MNNHTGRLTEERERSPRQRVDETYAHAKAFKNVPFIRTSDDILSKTQSQNRDVSFSFR